MDNTTIQKFLDEHDYDIRKTHNGRWIDQKCTMDVVCLVCVILEVGLKSASENSGSLL